MLAAAFVGLLCGTPPPPEAPGFPTVRATSSSSMMVRWTSPNSLGGPITTYELQWRGASSGSSSSSSSGGGGGAAAAAKWTTLPSAGLGLVDATLPPPVLNEVQVVWTRADAAISSGSFRLSLEGGSSSSSSGGGGSAGHGDGLNTFAGGLSDDPTRATVTDEIPWDASADAVQAALQKLATVECVHVTRRAPADAADAQSGRQDGSAFHCAGCHAWTVEFSRRGAGTLACAGSAHAAASVRTEWAQPVVAAAFSGGSAGVAASSGGTGTAHTEAGGGTALALAQGIDELQRLPLAGEGLSLARFRSCDASSEKDIGTVGRLGGSSGSAAAAAAAAAAASGGGGGAQLRGTGWGCRNAFDSVLAEGADGAGAWVAGRGENVGAWVRVFFASASRLKFVRVAQRGANPSAASAAAAAAGAGGSGGLAAATAPARAKRVRLSFPGGAPPVELLLRDTAALVTYPITTPADGVVADWAKVEVLEVFGGAAGEAGFVELQFLGVPSASDAAAAGGSGGGTAAEVAAAAASDAAAAARAAELPLLAVYSDSIGAAWADPLAGAGGATGASHVVVARTQRGGAAGATCGAAQAGGGAGCSQPLTGLAAGAPVTVRVRAHSAAGGWGALSPESDPVRTAQRSPPSAPAAPLLASRSPSHLTLRLERPASDGGVALRLYELQAQAVGGGGGGGGGTAQHAACAAGDAALGPGDAGCGGWLPVPPSAGSAAAIFLVGRAGSAAGERGGGGGANKAALLPVAQGEEAARMVAAEAAALERAAFASGGGGPAAAAATATSSLGPAAAAAAAAAACCVRGQRVEARAGGQHAWYRGTVLRRTPRVMDVALAAAGATVTVGAYDVAGAALGPPAYVAVPGAPVPAGASAFDGGGGLAAVPGSYEEALGDDLAAFSPGLQSAVDALLLYATDQGVSAASKAADASVGAGASAATPAHTAAKSALVSALLQRVGGSASELLAMSEAALVALANGVLPNGSLRLIDGAAAPGGEAAPDLGGARGRGAPWSSAPGRARAWVQIRLRPAVSAGDLRGMVIRWASSADGAHHRCASDYVVSASADGTNFVVVEARSAMAASAERVDHVGFGAAGAHTWAAGLAPAASTEYVRLELSGACNVATEAAAMYQIREIELLAAHGSAADVAAGGSALLLQHGTAGADGDAQAALNPAAVAAAPPLYDVLFDDGNAETALAEGLLRALPDSESAGTGEGAGIAAEAEQGLRGVAAPYVLAAVDLDALRASANAAALGSGSSAAAVAAAAPATQWRFRHRARNAAGWGAFSVPSQSMAAPAAAGSAGSAGGAAARALQGARSSWELGVADAASGALLPPSPSPPTAALPPPAHVGALSAGVSPPAAADSPSDAAIVLSSTQLRLRWQPPASAAAPLSGYEVRYRPAGAFAAAEEAAAWSAPVAVSGSVGDGAAAAALDSTRGRNEVQTVSTRADAGQTISDGTFRLSLAAHGRHGGRAEDGAVTAPIAYDADAAAMQAALQALDNIAVVQVRRTGPDGQGGYAWSVTFDPPTGPVRRGGHASSTSALGAARETETSNDGARGGGATADVVHSNVGYGDGPYEALNRGDVPLLSLHSEGISAAWSAGGAAGGLGAVAAQVSVAEVVKGGAAGSFHVCSETGGGVGGQGGDLGPAAGGVLCGHTLGGLAAGEQYEVAVRAVAAASQGGAPVAGGWSAVVGGTARLGVPGRVLPPTLSSVTSGSATLLLAPPVGEQALNGTAVTALQVQAQMWAGRPGISDQAGGVSTAGTAWLAPDGAAVHAGTAVSAWTLALPPAGAARGGLHGGQAARRGALAGVRLPLVVAPLVNGTLYAFRARALNAAGAGMWSEPSVPIRVALAAPPAPPAPLPRAAAAAGTAATAAAVGASATPLTLGVGPSPGAVSGYDVRCRCALDAGWSVCGSADAGAAAAGSAVLFGAAETVEVATALAKLRWGMSYRFSARGRNSAGAGEWGPEAMAKTAPAPQSTHNQHGSSAGANTELDAFALLSSDKATEVASSLLQF